MSAEKPPPFGQSGFKPPARKTVKVSQEALVTTSLLEGGAPFPLVIQPNAEHVNLLTWAQTNQEFIDSHLLRYGGLLFRSFGLDSEAHLEQFILGTSTGALEYTERSSPRSQVRGNIYTSTDHPASQSIFLHNEQSYNRTFPLKIFFFCMLPAQQGGETPLCDTRKVFQRIDPAVRACFIAKNYMYVRNFGDGFGLSWQAAFQTTDKAAVATYCRKNDIMFEWKGDNRLRTRQVRRAVAQHPRTGEFVWFNHITFFHVALLEPKLRDKLLSEFKEEDLPNNTYYGDGSPIESEILDQLRQIYQHETIAFPWQQGDLLMLDNMLAAHGRAPFVGPRNVVVGMADPYSWDDMHPVKGII
jgi:alpha-ketoglutarate-dependent taurine dioxygenase